MGKATIQLQDQTLQVQTVRFAQMRLWGVLLGQAERLCNKEAICPHGHDARVDQARALVWRGLIPRASCPWINPLTPCGRLDNPGKALVHKALPHS
jgi:hypothetical protein